MTIKREDIRAAIRKLAELCPGVFVADSWEPHRPLKIGISHELVALDVLPLQVLKGALGAYTARRMYQASLVAGADRIGLDGLPAGTVTEDQAESAAERLKALDEHRAEVAAQANQAFKALKGAVAKVEALTGNNSEGTVGADPGTRTITGEAATPEYPHAAGNSTITASSEAPRRLSLADLKAAARVRRTA